MGHCPFCGAPLPPGLEPDEIEVPSDYCGEHLPVDEPLPDEDDIPWPATVPQRYLR